MASSVTQKLKDLIGVIAGDESTAAGDYFVNMLLSLDSRGCPGLDSEGCHTVEFFLCRHIDGAIQRAEHAAAVCRRGVGVALDLAHVGEGIVDVAAVF